MALNDLELALLCQDQYDGKTPLKTVSEVDYSRIDDAEGIKLIFQGTANLDDARRDLDFPMINVGWGRVHQGAYDGLNNVLDTENLPTNVHILLFGHSLGSMEAAIAKRLLFQRGYRSLEVLALEPPHYGNAEAVAYSGNDNERGYQNYKDFFQNDIFTMIPPHLLLEPYVPAANLTRYWQSPSPNNEYKIKYNAPENIQAHSLLDCCIPALRKIFGGEK